MTRAALILLGALSMLTWGFVLGRTTHRCPERPVRAEDFRR